MQLFTKITSILVLSVFCLSAMAQDELPLPVNISTEKGIRQPGRQQSVNPSMVPGMQSSAAGEKDSLGFTHRDDSKEAVSVSWRFLDSVRRYNMDSSINDFDRYFPVPSCFNYLGNTGAAAYSVLFAPGMRPGWDAGFHAFDLYKFRPENTKLYRTTRPFTSLQYQLASGKEQMIQVLHVQNPKPNIGFGLEYRMINAPGFFVTQNTNHNSYRFYSNYVGKKKRYRAQLLALGNILRASENGGIVNDSSLSDPNKRKRFSVPVNLGGSFYVPNPFQTTVKTGNTYEDVCFRFTQAFDFGRRDTLPINDSLIEFLYFPRFRLQHTVQYSSENYRFRDEYADSSLYADWYGRELSASLDTFERSEQWRILENDVSVYQFPDPRNTTRFIRAGARYQSLRSAGKPDFHNLIIHGQIRLPSSNLKWDMHLSGEYFAEGRNGGDFVLSASLGRRLSRRGSFLYLEGIQVNRNPYFIYDSLSAFNLGNEGGFRKENITLIGARLESPSIQLAFRNYLLSNYCYLSDYYHTAQYSRVFNVMQLSASRKFFLGKRWSWYLDVTGQQTDGAAPVNLPLLYSRSRLAFEGLFFKNLNLCAGIETRYCSPWKMPGYSPVMGAFVPQDSVTVSNRPDMAAFLHFRIKGFNAFLRAENLNTADFSGGLSFTKNNFTALHYPGQGLMIRLGIRWWFVN